MIAAVSTNSKERMMQTLDENFKTFTGSNTVNRKQFESMKTAPLQNNFNSNNMQQQFATLGAAPTISSVGP